MDVIDQVDAPEQAATEQSLQAGLIAPRITKEESERRKSENDRVLQQQPHSLWYYSWRRLRRNRLAMAGLIITVLLIFTAVFASDLAPFDPNMQVLEYSTEPIGFQGNVLLTKSEVDPSQTIPIPIVEYRVQEDRVIYTTDEGRDHSIPISRLAGASESEWHKTPTYYFGTDRYGRDVLSRLKIGRA